MGVKGMCTSKRIFTGIAILMVISTFILIDSLVVDPMSRVRLYTKLGGDHDWALFNLLPAKYLEERFSGKNPVLIGLQPGSKESVIPGDWFCFIDSDPLTLAVQRRDYDEYDVLTPTDGDTYSFESCHMPFRLTYRIVSIVSSEHGPVALFERTLEKISQ